MLSANRTSLVGVSAAREARPGIVRLALPYAVSNLLVEPGIGLSYELVLEVEVLPAASESSGGVRRSGSPSLRYRASLRSKRTVTVIRTGTGTPSISVGV